MRRTPAGSRRRSVVRRQLVIHLTSDRTVPVVVALVVLLAGVVSLGPGAVQPVGAAQAAAPSVRLAIGGGVAAHVDPSILSDAAATGDPLAGTGDFVDDGTLYKPVAVDTSIQSAADLLRHYTVRSGDTLSTIAAKFQVSTMTIWWANHLTAKDQLHVGQVLVIPPVNGLVIVVQAGDTLQSLGTKYSVSPDAIVEANGLSDPNLIVGQVLLMPGAKGAPIPTPKATTTRSTTHTTTRTLTYTSGTWHWPVVGGGNYISQYFSSYHPAIDIAAPYGTPIVAARPGKVIETGYTVAGCGLSVAISLGNGLYTYYCHMSAVRVSVGQVVAKGQQVGNVGMTGWATGTHLHFEVWVGYPWKSTSYRVNPLRYY